jgi:hypothetical protein
MSLIHNEIMYDMSLMHSSHIKFNLIPGTSILKILVLLLLKLINANNKKMLISSLNNFTSYEFSFVAAFFVFPPFKLISERALKNIPYLSSKMYIIK